MTGTTIFAIALISTAALLAVAVFAVAWRRGPAGPIVGEFEPEAPDAVAVVAAEKEAAAGPETTPPAEPPAAPAHAAETVAAVRRIPVTEAEMGVTRRKFLNRASFGLFAGAFFASLGLGMLSFLWPKLKGGFGTPINAGNLSSLRDEIIQDDGTLIPKFIPPAQSWLVVMDEKDVPGSSFEGLPVLAGGGVEPGVMALWQRCVHLGCRVPECTSSQGFECPCHGSRYNFHGEYEAGPAPRNLDRFEVAVNDAGDLIINTGTIFQTPRAHHKTAAYPQGPSCL
jgi:cytochrome b6-f complex iron-sulfur subunit